MSTETDKNIMPSKSESQRNFMWLVHGVQKGKIPAEKSGSKVTKAAKSMTPSDVEDFLMQECGLRECGEDPKIRILKVLKELQEPMNLQEDQEDPAPEVVASTKTFHGDYKKTLAMYRGFEFTPKENQAIQNFDGAQPNLHDKFKVGYSKSDEYGNTTSIIVKKLREPDGKFVFVALVKNRAGEDETPEEPEPQNTPEEPQQGGKPPTAGAPPAVPSKQPPLKEAGEEMGDEIKIIKSVPIDDNSGDEILTNFLQSIYYKNA